MPKFSVYSSFGKYIYMKCVITFELTAHLLCMNLDGVYSSCKD